MKTTKELIIADITAKVEAKLASQKVELSLVDDLNKVISDYKKSNANYEVAFKEHAELDKRFMSLKSKAKEFNVFDEKTYAEAQKIIEKIKVQAKELGIDRKEVIATEI